MFTASVADSLMPRSEQPAPGLKCVHSHHPFVSGSHNRHERRSRSMSWSVRQVTRLQVCLQGGDEWFDGFANS